MVSHAVDGISSSGMKEGLARRCSWGPLPPSRFGVCDTRISTWVVVPSSSLFCCCCEVEDGSSVVFNAGLSLLPVKCSLVAGDGLRCWPWKTSIPSLSCVVLVLLDDGEARSSEVSLILFAILTFGVDSDRCCFGMEESSFVEVCMFVDFLFLCVRLSALKLLVPSKVLNSFEICVLVVGDGCRGISRSVGAPLRQVKVPVGSRTCEMVGRSGV